MSIVKESELDVLEPKLQERQTANIPHEQSFPLLIGWLPADLEQLEKENRLPVVRKRRSASSLN